MGTRIGHASFLGHFSRRVALTWREDARVVLLLGAFGGSFGVVVWGVVVRLVSVSKAINLPIKAINNRSKNPDIMDNQDFYI